VACNTNTESINDISMPATGQSVGANICLDEIVGGGNCADDNTGVDGSNVVASSVGSQRTFKSQDNELEDCGCCN